MRKQEIDYVLTKMLDSHERVSDLNITVGKPFQVETSGELVGVEVDPPFGDLTPFQTEVFALNLLNQDRRLTEDLLTEGACDRSYELSGKARFRVNIFSQQSSYSIVMRKIETKIPTIAEMEFPEVFCRMTEERDGLILFTGATGSGKSTSLAAILDEINERRRVHIVTLEDPVEFQHPHKRATFNQRDMGTDFDNYASGLRAALRQAPKVILVGEMRDRETVDIALRAAETGHLVLSTLHTMNAGATIKRILGMYPTEDENQIRNRLAEAIRWVVCQRLPRTKDGGRTAAFEIMGRNIRVVDAILNGESEGKTFYDIIRGGAAFGWTTFDDDVIRLYEKGLVTEETARATGTNPGVVGRGIDTVKSRRGEATTDIDDLQVDFDYSGDSD